MKKDILKLTADNNWEETARQHARNEEFYHNIVVSIGEPFGIEAKTSDDGSIQEDVLALKVPELVDSLRQEAERLEGLIYEAIGWTMAFCCSALDNGNDPREIECPAVLEKAITQIGLIKLKQTPNP